MVGLHWRRVLAALGNSDARTAFAQIVLGTQLTGLAIGLLLAHLRGQ